MSIVEFVVNPSFEDDPISYLQGGAWATNIWGAGINVPSDPFSLELTDVYDGLRAVKCSVQDPAGNQFVVGQITNVSRTVLDPSKFVPGETYTLQIAYKSDVDLRILFQASGGGIPEIGEGLDIPASPAWVISPPFNVLWPDAFIDYIQWFVMLNNQAGTFLMDSASLTGVLAPEIYALNMIVEGMGATDPIPGTYSTVEGDVVTATATADDGHYFLRWYLNGVPYEENPLSFMMNSNVTLRAVFKPIGVEPTPIPWEILAIAGVALLRESK